MSWSRISRRAFLPGQTPTPVWALILFAVYPMTAVAEPAQTVPSDGLAVYVEYDGLATHGDAWKATAAYAMFEQTPAGAMTADIARQVVDRLLRSLPDPKPSGAELLSLQEQIQRQGFALGLYDEADLGASCVVVLNGFGRGEGREWASRLIRIATRPGSEANDGIAVSSRIRGREIFQVNGRARAIQVPGVPFLPEAPEAIEKSSFDALAWWFEGDDLIVVVGPTALNADGAKNDATRPHPLRIASVIDAIQAKVSSVLTHPGRAAALAEGQDVKGFESDGLFFVEADKAQRLYSRHSKWAGRDDDPDEGQTLPAGKSTHDDVEFFAPLPVLESLEANPRRSQLRELGLDLTERANPPVEDLPKVASTPPNALASPPPLPDELLKPQDAGRDPAVSKTGTIAGPTSQEKTKDPVSTAKALLGLDGITRVVGRWGFQDKAFLTAVRVEAPAPRRGLMAMLNQAGFRKDRLPPIPRGARNVMIGSFDAVKAYDAGRSEWSKGPQLGGVAEAARKFSKAADLLVFETTGQRLREAILGHFGSTWCLYSAPARQEDKSDPQTPILLVEVDDAKAFAKVLDALATRINAFLCPPENRKDGKSADGLPAVLALEPLPAPDRGYRLTTPAGIVSWLGEGQQPTIQVGESYVAFAANPDLTRAALATASQPAAERWTPSGELTKAFECLPAELTSLTVGDPDNSTWPTIFVYLPKLVQHMASIFDATKDDRPGTAWGPRLLGMLGVPQADGFRLRIQPANQPKAEALKAQLFPSVLATSVDDRGIRFIAREAIPFACSGPGFRCYGNTPGRLALVIGLRPFLFPCFYVQLKYSPQKPGVNYLLGMKWKFATNAVAND
ncbi:hypothetical protein SAMN05444166_2936 [Singulisphaera sp. GP187]|uniref:hypothetical protein n=1 Tax=Singulisphaera sp. GP187 TaxID=1882752 RepID=UPI00092AECD6|nr:hypothetical protein [Singulisphaera sp. GP187]SIO19674.1 hypothetical protein SAMN05444166_2936 [Singulisphaera sp. GP187]